MRAIDLHNNFPSHNNARSDGNKINAARQGEKVKKMLLGLVVIGVGIVLAGCSSDADVASYNLSKDADNFKVLRRIVFYNGITGDYILSVEGYCSLGNDDTDRKRTVICKLGPDKYKKHFLGLSDNVTYFAEQLESKDVSEDHYKVIFKPTEIIPNIEKR